MGGLIHKYPYKTAEVKKGRSSDRPIKPTHEAVEEEDNNKM